MDTYKNHKIFYNNGYPEIYLQTHHRARSSGAVCVHILQMEEKLGRLLDDNEVVHHCDENRSNYNFENLWCFSSQRDHVGYHKGLKILLNEKGAYYCPELKHYHLNEYYCKNCGIPTKFSKKYCQKCFHISTRKVNRPSKEKLTSLISNTSFVKIGKMYGVSDNTIRKWCKFYNLPYKKI